MPPVTEMSSEGMPVIVVPSPGEAFRAIQLARAAECRHPVCDEQVKNMSLWVMTGRTALERIGEQVDEHCAATSHDLKATTISVGKLLMSRCTEIFKRRDPSAAVEQWHGGIKEWVARPEHTKRTRRTKENRSPEQPVKQEITV